MSGILTYRIAKFMDIWKITRFISYQIYGFIGYQIYGFISNQIIGNQICEISLLMLHALHNWMKIVLILSFTVYQTLLIHIWTVQKQVSVHFSSNIIHNPAPASVQFMRSHARNWITT